MKNEFITDIDSSAVKLSRITEWIGIKRSFLQLTANNGSPLMNGGVKKRWYETEINGYSKNYVLTEN